MSIRSSIAATVPAICLMLAACGDGASDPKTADEVIAEAANLVKPLPGQYRSSAEMISFDVPGLPPAQADRLKEMAGGLSSSDQTFCLTQEQADQGFADTVRQLGEGDGKMSCEFTRFDADGSALDAALSCSGMGASATMDMTGELQPDRSKIRMEMSQSAGPIPGGSMDIVMEIVSERIGDCT